MSIAGPCFPDTLDPRELVDGYAAFLRDNVKPGREQETAFALIADITDPAGDHSLAARNQRVRALIDATNQVRAERQVLA